MTIHADTHINDNNSRVAGMIDKTDKKRRGEALLGSG